MIKVDLMTGEIHLEGSGGDLLEEWSMITYQLAETIAKSYGIPVSEVTPDIIMGMAVKYLSEKHGNKEQGTVNDIIKEAMKRM